MRTAGKLRGFCLARVLVLSLPLLVFGQCVRGKAPSTTLQMLFPMQQVSAGVSPPAVTFSTESTLYVSGQVGARNSAQLAWSASDAGNFTIRLSTDCGAGPVLSSGAYANPGEEMTVDFSAGSYSAGVTPVCVRVTNARGGYGEKQAFLVRDDDAPTVSVTPGAGAYGAIPTIAISCVDPGGSGCNRTAMRVGADPTMDLNGVTAGIEYTAPFSPPDSATTAYRFKVMDRAGNQSAVTTATYVVDSVLPVITVTSVSPSTLAISSGVISFVYKTNVKGTATLHVGGTDCEAGTSGTLLATSAIPTIAPATARGISASAASVAANLAAGPNEVRLCVRNTAGLVGFTTRTITRDNGAPTIVNLTVPSGTVDPNSITFLVDFSEPMAPGSCPLSATIQGSSVVGCAANSTWITNQSLQVKVFPIENMEVSWSLVSLRDLANNQVAAPPTGTFRTSMQAKRRFRVTETAQSFCYDISGAITPCAGTGQNGLNPSGPLPMLLSAPYAPNGSYPLDAVVDDQRTGLMWMVCPTTQSWSGISCTGPVTIESWTILAASHLFTANNQNANAGYAGFRDWRLPTAAELSTIKIYDTAGAPLPSAFFPNAARVQYMTSTGTGTSSIYYMGFFNNGAGGGDTMVGAPVSTSGVALLVRDPNPGPVPPGFTDNQDGTIGDPLNQLTWQKCSAGQSANDCSDPVGSFGFANAVSYCENLGLAGRVWRLPTIKELKSLADFGATVAPYVFADFPGSSGEYWTSTVYGGNNPLTAQQVLRTVDGTAGLSHRSTDLNSVRCVSGP